MPLSTQQRAIDSIEHNGGQIKKIQKQNGETYFHMNCKNGHPLIKDKRSILYGNQQYCTYYPCNAGKKTEWRDRLGFKLFKERLKEIFGEDIICIEKTPEISVKFKFKCSKCGHKWENSPSYQLTTPKRKKRPPSCKNCGGSKKTSSVDIKEYLKEFNLSALNGIEAIKNQTTKFHYRCNHCGDSGCKTLNNLLNLKKNNLGYCDCTYKRTHWTLEKMIKVGKENNYTLVGRPKDINSNKIYKWKCQLGHITSFSISSLKNGCLTCLNNKRFSSLAKIKEWLKKYESTITLIPNQNWKGSHYSYNFQCEICNKAFNRAIHSILSGSHCPNISKSYSELVVKHYLEKLLGFKFISNKKYEFLKNSVGNKMELDGFNEENRIAFEHHGIQHYRGSIYHKEIKSLSRRKSDDLLKEKLCLENNIKLIIIPALFEITPISELKNVIKEELLRLEIKIPDNFEQINLELRDMNKYHKKKK
jgi:hypothetical protein